MSRRIASASCARRHSGAGRSRRSTRRSRRTRHRLDYALRRRDPDRARRRRPAATRRLSPLAQPTIRPGSRARWAARGGQRLGAHHQHRPRVVVAAARGARMQRWSVAARELHVMASNPPPTFGGIEPGSICRCRADPRSRNGVAATAGRELDHAPAHAPAAARGVQALR